jgi:putative OPT family oligopeptide transporter
MHSSRGSSEGSATALREITVRAVILGIVLSVLLAGANAYLGLFAGMTVSASIPAAVISMGLLRMFRRHSILENNIVQTAASAGEALAAGVIFTIPALVLMGYWEEFDFFRVTAIAGAGGVLGVLFSIPLRRALIPTGELRFPEGVATAEVLRVGEGGGRDVRFILWSGVAGALFKLGETAFHLWSATLEGAWQVGRSILYVGSNLSPALVSVGYIVRFNIAVLVALGGVFSWYVAIPLYCVLTRASGEVIAQPLDTAYEIWSGQIRYLGVGAMVVGGLWALINMRRAIAEGFRSGVRMIAPGRAEEAPAAGPGDIPLGWAAVGVLVLLVPIAAIYVAALDNVPVALVMTLLMVVAGFLFSAVAAYMAGLVGSSNNPVSGVTIATILFAALLLLALTGADNPAGAAGAILVGALVCCAAAISGDNMQDLKTGHLVGATPWKQQVMQIVGTVSAALVMAPILTLLHRAYGFGRPTPEHPNPLTAPQATLMDSVARGVFSGDLPWTMVGLGALAGVVVILIDRVLQARGARFRCPVLAVAVGIYLPLELSLPILLGGCIALVAHGGREGAEGQRMALAEQRGLLFASGLITGEALVGILIAIPIVLSGERDYLALANAPLGGWPGLVLVLGAALALFAVARGKLGTSDA